MLNYNYILFIIFLFKNSGCDNSTLGNSSETNEILFETSESSQGFSGKCSNATVCNLNSYCIEGNENISQICLCNCGYAGSPYYPPGCQPLNRTKITTFEFGINIPPDFPRDYTILKSLSAVIARRLENELRSYSIYVQNSLTLHEIGYAYNVHLNKLIFSTNTLFSY